MATQTLQLDRQTRATIADTIAKAVRQQMESYDERWVLAQELCELLPALSPDFLRRHGDSFPRKRFVVEFQPTRPHGARLLIRQMANNQEQS